MKTAVTTIKEYLDTVPEERKKYFAKLRKTIKDNIPKGFKECINYGMIGYVVPHSLYPDGYHCDPKLPLPFAHIASQKNFIALYHSGIYSDPKIHDWFVEEYPKHCKYKLNMGKSCVRFKKPEDIPFDLIAELMQKFTVDEWIKMYDYHHKK